MEGCGQASRVKLAGGKVTNLRDALFLDELGDDIEGLASPLADAVERLDQSDFRLIVLRRLLSVVRLRPEAHQEAA